MADTPIIGVLCILFEDEWSISFELPNDFISKFPNDDPHSFGSPLESHRFTRPLPTLDADGAPLVIELPPETPNELQPEISTLDAVYYCQLIGPPLLVRDFIPQILQPTGLDQPAENDFDNRKRLPWCAGVLGALERSKRTRPGSTLHFVDYVVNKARQLAQNPDGLQIQVPEEFHEGWEGIRDFPAWHGQLLQLLMQRERGEKRLLR